MGANMRNVVLGGALHVCAFSKHGINFKHAVHQPGGRTQLFRGPVRLFPHRFQQTKNRAQPATDQDEIHH